MRKIGWIMIVFSVLYFGVYGFNVFNDSKTEQEIPISTTQATPGYQETFQWDYSDVQNEDTSAQLSHVSQGGERNNAVSVAQEESTPSQPKRIACPDCQGKAIRPSCSACDGSGQTKLGEDVPAQVLPGGFFMPAMPATYVTCMLCGGSGIEPCYTCYGGGTIANPSYVYTAEELRLEQEAAMQMIEGMRQQKAYDRELTKQYQEEQDIRHQQTLDTIRRQGDSYEAPDFGY